VEVLECLKTDVSSGVKEAENWWVCGQNLLKADDKTAGKEIVKFDRNR